MGCFTIQISLEWVHIGFVSMRWAIKLFLNLKVIKGPPIFPTHTFGRAQQANFEPDNRLNTLVVQLINLLKSLFEGSFVSSFNHT